MLISNMSQPLMYETVWFDKYKYDDAERQYEELAAQERKGEAEKPKCKSSLVDEIARARQHIISSLQSGDSVKVEMCDQERSSVLTQFQKLESENKEMKKTIQDLLSEMAKLNIRMTALESKISVQPPCVGNTSAKVVKTEENSNAVNDDDDIDLFGSDDEDEAATKLREERLKAYETKKSKKAPLVAKSSVVLDVKPWDDETDMQEMEMKVREIKCDGLKWGAGKLVPLAFGIKKLQIVCVVEDDKVSIDWLQETIQEIEDLVQSVDIAAFNKL